MSWSTGNGYVRGETYADFLAAISRGNAVAFDLAALSYQFSAIGRRMILVGADVLGIDRRRAHIPASTVR